MKLVSMVAHIHVLVAVLLIDYSVSLSSLILDAIWKSNGSCSRGLDASSTHLGVDMDAAKFAWNLAHMMISRLSMIADVASDASESSATLGVCYCIVRVWHVGDLSLHSDLVVRIASTA